MELTVSFGPGKKLECLVNGRTVATDAPRDEGGEAGAPTPSDYMLVSLATCGAYYVLSFCRTRDIPMDEVRFGLDARFNEKTKLYDRIEYRITVPGDFPDKYRRPLARSVDQCFVKKHFLTPPEFAVTVE